MQYDYSVTSHATLLGKVCPLITGDQGESTWDRLAPNESIYNDYFFHTKDFLMVKGNSLLKVAQRDGPEAFRTKFCEKMAGESLAYVRVYMGPARASVFSKSVSISAIGQERTFRAFDTKCSCV